VGDELSWGFGGIGGDLVSITAPLERGDRGGTSDGAVRASRLIRPAGLAGFPRSDSEAMPRGRFGKRCSVKGY